MQRPEVSAAVRPIYGSLGVKGIPNRLNYCVIFTVYTQFTNAAAGHTIKPGGPRVEYP